MFDFFRNLFTGKPSEGENAVQSETLNRPGLSSVPLSSAPQFRPKHARQTSPVPSNGAGAHEGTGNGNVINIPLTAVLAALPLEFKGRVRQIDMGDATLTISLDRVLSQLPQGAVKLPFGELRKAAPELFTTAGDFDQVEIALPLNEILSRINPATLVRRQNQKQVEIPAEIKSPFGDKGRELVVPATSSKTPAAKPVAQAVQPGLPQPAPAPIPNPELHPVKAEVVPPKSPGAHPGTLPRPSLPAHLIPQRPSRVSSAHVPPAAAAPAPVTPVQPVPMRNSVPVVPTAPVASPEAAEPSMAIPISSALRNLGASIGAPSQANGNGHSTHLVRPVAQPAAPAAEVPSLSLPLNALSENWPDAVRHEIAQLGLTPAQVALPVDQLEAAMKRGKVAFPWKTLRSWIRPTPLPTVSANDAAVLELPLKVVAPLFLSRKKSVGQPQQKVELDENIPNLFFGFPQPDAVTPEPVASAPVVPAPAPIVPAPTHIPAAVDTNYYVWADASDSAQVDETQFKRKPAIETNFLSRQATPNEVVARAFGLEGVVGALVALPDGLMVASKLPSELNGDTLAAFLPQIFGKMSQCTKELRMGDLNNLNFTVGNVPWKIFRVNAIFFAAFGRAGEGLPTAQLSALAAELDRKKTVS